MSIAEKLAGNPVVGGALVLVGAGALVYWLFGSRIAAALKTDLNPLSNENLAYRAAGAVVGAVTGASTAPDGSPDADFSLGGWLYDATHRTGPADVYYLVGFPDGSRHAIASSDVTDNRFTRDGVLYQLYSDAAGRFASPVGVKNTGGVTVHW